MAEEKPDLAWFNRGFTLSRFDGIKMEKRDRLISMMLQDRNALRLISAPHGYGKSMLAYQYAKRFFSTGEVVWIDGGSPEFLCALDKGKLVSGKEKAAKNPDLVVIDALPRLDETRRYAVSNCIEKLLLEGVEVVVTTLPSQDFLQDYQPDRVRITANDLLVHERDVKRVTAVDFDKDAASAREAWGIASKRLFGQAPCSVWSTSEEVRYECLTGFFDEQLPQEMHVAAFAMLLLGKGSYRVLEATGAVLDQETEGLMAQDYPFLGMNPLEQEFEVGEFSLEGMHRAVQQSQGGSRLLGLKSPIYERCLGILVERDEIQRASDILRIFCSAQRRESWLGEQGWELLDRGEITLLESLFAQCTPGTLESNAGLLALRSWLCGVSGDLQESSYFARLALGSIQLDGLEGESDRRSAVMAYFALNAFSQGGPLIYGKSTYGPVQIDCPVDFLAAVVDQCTEDEVSRALGVLEGNLAPAVQKRKSLAQVEKNRVEALEMLFTAYADRFQNTGAFRIALHLLAGINSERLRRIVYEVGGVMLIPLRRSGVKCFTHSVLVSDLWRCGYFGVGGVQADVRDSKLLDNSSVYFTRLARLSGREPASMPWNVSTVGAEKGGKVKSANKNHRGRVSVKDKTPIANVTLFGGLEVMVGDKYIPGNKFSRRALQMFSILVMYQGRDVSRQALLEYMWPTLSRTRALDNFYTAWSRATLLIGEEPYLMRRGDFCSVSPRYVHSDIAEFDQLVRRLLTERDDTSMLLDIYARMESIYRGGLLPSERGNEFIDSQRLRYKSTYVDGMVAASARSLDIHDARISLWFARKAMEEDPKREDVYYAMIRAQMASGQRCSALRTYFRCREYLNEELGLDPASDTQKLYDDLITSDPSLRELEPESFRV